MKGTEKAMSSNKADEQVAEKSSQESTKDEIKTLFDALFSYKNVMQQGHYFHVVQAHSEWLQRQRIGLGSTLSWQENKDLKELLIWLRTNYNVNDRH